MFKILTSWWLVIAVSTPALAQGLAVSERTIDAQERNAVIQGVLEKVEANYVFPDVGKKMVVAIRERQAKKEYDSITSGKEFAETLTKHLREVSKDKHLGVRLFADPLPKDFDRGPTDEQARRLRESAALRNYGFKKVERLGSGVGLLELEGFMPTEQIGETASAAMTFLSNSEAVIIDLRKNGGGVPATVVFLCSYFFDEPTHLNDIYTRTTDTTRQYWSHPVVPGKKLIGKDVYVLTSSRTFSGAEEFAYNLQSQKRATIVGETTGGGAHPTRGFRVTDHFGVGVPFARSINPITKTNWEVTGVKPDVAVPADQALLTAQMLALKKMGDKSSADPDKNGSVKRELETVRKELDALKSKSAAGSRP